MPIPLKNFLMNEEPPKDLFDTLQSLIEKEKRIISLRTHIFGFSSGLIGAVIATAIYWQSLIEEMSRTAFGAYVTTIWADRDLVFVTGKEMALSLLESVPVLTLLAVLFVVFFSFGTVAETIQLILIKRSRSNTILNHYGTT